MVDEGCSPPLRPYGNSRCGGFEWSHTFAKNYILGAKVDAYPMIEGELTNADGSVRSSAFFNNFSFGIYFRCHPRFLLVNYNKKRSDSYK